MLPLIYGKKLDQPEGQVDQERWDFQFLPDSVVGFCLLFFVCLFADGSAPGGGNGSGLLAVIHLHSPDCHQQPIEGV